MIFLALFSLVVNPTVSIHTTLRSVEIQRLPYSQEFTLSPGTAVVFSFASQKKTMAIWCDNRPYTGALANKAARPVNLRWGETPFKPVESYIRPLEGGEGIESVLDSRSYIRQGAVITFGQKDPTERHFFVESFKIIIKEHQATDSNLLVEVIVQPAAEGELEELKHGAELRQYSVSRLSDPAPAIRAKAIDQLVRYIREERLDSFPPIRLGLHESAKQLLEAIGKLQNDNDNTVRQKARAAVKALQEPDLSEAGVNKATKKRARDEEKRREGKRGQRRL